MSQRGQNHTNGSTTITEQGEGGESQPSGGTDSDPSRSENRQAGEGDQMLGGIVTTNRVPGQLQATPRFSTLSASSSGYHSLDISLPNSPFMTHNKSTQTPSPSSQVIAHAQQRISLGQQNLRDYDTRRAPVPFFRTRTLSMLPDMRPEMLVARELRRIGDKFNDIYINGRAGDGNLWAAPRRIQHMHVFVLWIANLLERLLQFLRQR
ncbi:bcl-2-like protein 11 [Paramormyrops kingsleyae]|uniref:bcl-2-like protein 11 n=1 Tax=Paramormyrops kingsleyae TaxID=1676925 RepID=UPI000CD60B5B|nr:bcl-2-like protein 11 [Paramormyrops kingsleyae]